jgi:hypothetical protein
LIATFLGFVQNSLWKIGRILAEFSGNPGNMPTSQQKGSKI